MEGLLVMRGNARQKSAVIKENAKYSFVELGKFNTSVGHQPNFKTVWWGSWLKSSVRGGSRIYTITERGAIRVVGETSTKNEYKA